MFGILKQIRDKSDSDIGEVERQINAELDQIAQFTQNSTRVNNRHQIRLQREYEVRTDSDNEARYRAQILATQQQQQQQSQQHDSDDQYQISLPQQRQAKKQLPMYSDEELEKEFQNRDRPVDHQPAYPFSTFSDDKYVRNGILTINNNQSHVNQNDVIFSRLQRDNADIEQFPIESQQHHKQQQLLSSSSTTIPIPIPQSKKNQSMRLKMAVFKLRVRTDKMLYHDFSKKIIALRKKAAMQTAQSNSIILQSRIQQLYHNKTEFVNELDHTDLHTLIENSRQQQQQQSTNPEDNHLSQVIPEECADDDDDDFSNMIITRTEMDSYIPFSSLQTQTNCFYCYLRPLHLFSTTYDLPILFTSENGLQHWKSIPNKMQIELLKGGKFVHDIEAIIWAVKWSLPIIPYNSNYITIHESNPNLKVFPNINYICDYIHFLQTQHLALQSPHQIPYQQPAELQQQQNVVSIDSDWFIIKPRSYQFNLDDFLQPTQFISTHNGILIYVKDQYALDIVCAIAAFNSCYTNILQLKSSTIPFTYQIEIFFNTGCCLCGQTELDHIHSLGHNTNNSDTNTTSPQTTTPTTSTQQQQQQQQPEDLDSIDESNHDNEVIIGTLRDSLGQQLDQYTYCVPHIKRISDIESSLFKSRQSDD